MISAQSAKVSHFSPSPVPPETSCSLEAMSAGSVELASSAASASRFTASKDSAA